VRASTSPIMHATHAPLINLTAVPKHDAHGSQANPGRPEASTQPAPPNSRTARGHTIKPPAYGSVGSYVDRRIEPPRKLQTLSRYGNRWIETGRSTAANGDETRTYVVAHRRRNYRGKSFAARSPNGQTTTESSIGRPAAGAGRD
jgi:hypothetical protein